MARWWNEFPPSQPRRPARGGIKARSKKGAIGETWWSRRFVAALEGLADSGRLTRGRSYARTGQVMDLAVEPGLVTARVQGSRREPYEVRIAVKTLTEAQWARAERAMAEQAIFAAALLAGEMPPDIEDAFRAARLSLFPDSARDLETDCSCPDWGNPCKHVAATYYILAERFDEDPFLIFAWRGRTRERLVERLRKQRARRGAGSASADTAAGGREAAAAPGEEPEEDDEAEALPAEPAAFWGTAADVPRLRIAPHAPAVPDALLRQLGPPPLDAPGEDLAERLAHAYALFTAAAERRAFGEG